MSRGKFNDILDRSSISIKLEGRMIAYLITIKPIVGKAHMIVSAFRQELTLLIKSIPGCLDLWVIMTDDHSTIHVFTLWSQQDEKSKKALSEAIFKVRELQQIAPLFQKTTVMSYTS